MFCLLKPTIFKRQRCGIEEDMAKFIGTIWMWFKDLLD